MPYLHKTEAWNPENREVFQNILRQLVIADEGMYGILPIDAKSSLFDRFSGLIKHHTECNIELTTIKRVLGKRPSGVALERLPPKILAAFIDTIQKERSEQGNPELTENEKRDFWVQAGYPEYFKDVEPKEIYKHVQDLKELGRVVEEIEQAAQITRGGLHRAISPDSIYALGDTIVRLIANGRYSRDKTVLSLSTAGTIFALYEVFGQEHFLEEADTKTLKNRSQLFCELLGYPYEAVVEEAKKVKPFIDQSIDMHWERRKLEDKSGAPSVARIAPVGNDTSLVSLAKEAKTLSELAWEQCSKVLRTNIQALQSNFPIDELYSSWLAASQVTNPPTLDAFKQLLGGELNCSSLSGWSVGRQLGIEARKMIDWQKSVLASA